MNKTMQYMGVNSWNKLWHIASITIQNHGYMIHSDVAGPFQYLVILKSFKFICNICVSSSKTAVNTSRGTKSVATWWV